MTRCSNLHFSLGGRVHVVVDIVYVGCKEGGYIVYNGGNDGWHHDVHYNVVQAKHILENVGG